MRVMLWGFSAALALVAASNAWAANGQAIYNEYCAACHNNLSPKLGDKAAWAPLIKLGTDTLVKNVIAGKGVMPPRAGKNVSDADIKAAVEYIESHSQ